MGRSVTTFTFDDGIYIYDWENTHRIYHEYKNHNRGRQIIDRLVDESGYEEATVKGWLYHKHGPSDPKGIEALAKVFGRDIHFFIKLVEQKGRKMNNTIGMDKTIARNLYGELLEMIQLIEWQGFDPEDISPMVKYEKKGYFANQEDARAHYLLAVRKTALDLPAWMREQLSSLVDDCFGDYDTDYNEMYFNSDDYKEYLQNNGLNDNSCARLDYSATFQVAMYKRLDEIFKDYICI